MALGHHLPAVDDPDLVAEQLHVVEQVAREEERDAALLASPRRTRSRISRMAAGSSPFIGSSSTTRSGRPTQRLRDAEALAHAQAVAAHGAVLRVREPHRGRAAAARRPGRRAREPREDA